jgi:hypothetical protein
MAEGYPPTKNRSGTENPAGSQTLSPPYIAPPEQAVSPEVRDELTALMQDLLLKAHELSFEYSTLDCEKIQECPLARKSRELFRVVKHLNEVVKKMTPPPKAEYVR